MMIKIVVVTLRVTTIITRSVMTTLGGRRAPGALALLLLSDASLQARTITLTAEDCDEMAAISSLAPRLSWVMGPNYGYYNPQPGLYWTSPIALLMRFPIKESIPKGQRITKAELTIASTYVSGAPEVELRRILAEWGAGVSHQYRMTYPKKIEWAQPGGRGNATDRSNKRTASLKIDKIGAYTMDVTEDVELWYTGAAPNRGWIFTVENEGHVAYFSSPYSPQFSGGKQWKLQITFEPQ